MNNSLYSSQQQTYLELHTPSKEIWKKKERDKIKLASFFANEITKN